MTDTYRLYIDGGWREAGNGSYPIVNPATEEPVGDAPNASEQDALDAAAAARAAFPAWSRTAPEVRAELLDRAADLFDKRYEEFVPLVQAETGATLRVTKTMQVPSVSARFRRYARGAMEKLDIAVEPQVMPTTALAPGGIIGGVVHRAPVGVVACITSYNFPLVNMAGKLGPALAMGNTVVVKPAPQDPLAIVRLAEVFEEAGFPPGVVNVVVAQGSEPAEALVASPDVDMISFTGSTGVGQHIGSVAGNGMKRLLLELGGKGASIIFDDADLKKAIAGTGSVWSFHSGQICTAPTRVLAQRGVYDHVVAGLQQYAGALAVGDPLEKTTVLGRSSRARTATGSRAWWPRG
jgi:acyl-CoA reductase-like NAD-dependent aldehyde dehydrogenase